MHHFSDIKIFASLVSQSHFLSWFDLAFYAGLTSISSSLLDWSQPCFLYWFVLKHPFFASLVSNFLYRFGFKLSVPSCFQSRFLSWLALNLGFLAAFCVELPPPATSPTDPEDPSLNRVFDEEPLPAPFVSKDSREWLLMASTRERKCCCIRAAWSSRRRRARLGAFSPPIASPAPSGAGPPLPVVVDTTSLPSS